MAKTHSFHIPVLGIGYSIDSPIKVAHYGIDSVVSLVDDMLLEKLRKMYSERFEIPYREISQKLDDFRAKRISSYLNMLQKIVSDKFNTLMSSGLESGSELMKYFDMLPDTSGIKRDFYAFVDNLPSVEQIYDWLKENLQPGSIDVNIMTKVDKENYKNGKKLPQEYNDAFAAIRGFAQSKLHASVVLSAGMNPRLYAYMENFEDFYPDASGYIKKKIIIKVSDYRSALIQGKFFAKKGLWVSEYRIESGLNCGGHAFATDGYLMGPILEEFKNNRQNLIQEIATILNKALESKGKPVPKTPLPLRITAQGGVGTGVEHRFLLDYYHLDSIGWGSPFLLVPEATSVDEETLNQLAKAQEKDLYLSGISPLGVPFNSLRGNTKDIEKMQAVTQGRPGSACPKELLVSNNEFTERRICTASRQYQRLKIKELDASGLSGMAYRKEFEKIVEKACICVGLGTSILKANRLDIKTEGEGVSVCPGPNMAYFSHVKSLTDMLKHIYGKITFTPKNRPNLFLKELQLYIDYIENELHSYRENLQEKKEKYILKFLENLESGIRYYKTLFSGVKHSFTENPEQVLSELHRSEKRLQTIKIAVSKQKI